MPGLPSHVKQEKSIFTSTTLVGYWTLANQSQVSLRKKGGKRRTTKGMK